MTYSETAHFTKQRRGATREARSEANPQALLKALMLASKDVYLRTEQERILGEGLEAVLENEEMIKTAIVSWLQLVYNRLLKSDFPLNGNGGAGAASTAKEKERRAEEKQKRYDEVKQNFTKAAAETAQLMMLELKLPNGKALGDCTGSECRKMSRTMSPWLKKVADAVRPRQKVRDVLNEAAVRKLYGR